jgi:hypothetical protein
MRRVSPTAFWVAAAGLAVGASRWVLRARLPDDWDSIGFVRAVRDFDLARLQPHFPGYPVYVALTRVLDGALNNPLDAATAVSALAAAATAIGIWRLAGGLSGVRAGWCALCLYAAASLPLLLGGAALSDGTATAFAVLAFTGLRARRPALGGIAIALMVGTRLSYWPLGLSWLIFLRRGQRREVLAALAGAALGTVGWLVPLASHVGLGALWKMGRTHALGHFTEWGGSIATQPSLALRASRFARDLFYDGFAPQPIAFAGAALIAAAIVVLAVRAKRPSRNALVEAALLCGPYALWVFFAQNVVAQPRHLLPLVVAAIIALGCAAAARPLLGLALCAACAAASFPLALTRVREAPAAAQAADWVSGAYPPSEVVVIGGRAIRFFNLRDPAIVTRERTWLSEVDVELERLNVLPPHILVTDEVEPDPQRAPRLSEVKNFCRDPRLDRAQPCVKILEYGRGRAP